MIEKLIPVKFTISCMHFWEVLCESGAQSGCLSIIIEELGDAVNAKIKSDRRVKIAEFCIEFPNMSRGTLFEIVKECLGYKKVCVWLLPKILTSDHLTKIIAACLEFLVRYHKEDDNFLDQIVICNETWVSHVTHEN